MRLWVNEQRKPHFAYIECVRGWAVLMVILCHTTYLLPRLPYPVHRVAVLGWHGVQLFFLASTVTLMMSWQYEKFRNGAVDIAAFFLRRFFRIAPAYYLAATLYFWLEPPVSGFDLIHAAAACLFINAWHPVLMGVTPNTWTVVPGGWSIGVEFTFYAVLPILAYTITCLSRAIYLLLAALVVGATINLLLWPTLQATFGTLPADKFLYFWFPNQMSVFALGLCLYHLLNQASSYAAVSMACPNLIAGMSLVLVGAIGFVALPSWLSLQIPLPPTFILISLALSIFVLALAQARPGLLLNRPLALMGRVSFSAYLLHFAVLKIVGQSPYLQDILGSSGLLAIAAFAFIFLSVVLIVLAASWCTYRLIELPMMGVGKALIRRRRRNLSRYPAGSTG